MMDSLIQINPFWEMKEMSEYVEWFITGKGSYGSFNNLGCQYSKLYKQFYQTCVICIFLAKNYYAGQWKSTRVKMMATYSGKL